jgi:hypothetical protein
MIKLASVKYWKLRKITDFAIHNMVYSLKFLDETSEPINLSYT